MARVWGELHWGCKKQCPVRVNKDGPAACRASPVYPYLLTE
jgi:hypothetical protein